MINYKTNKDYIAARELGAASDFKHMFVPGRIEILGKHTDYAGGSSIVAASSLGIHFSYRPRQDRRVSIHAIDFDEVATIHPDTRQTREQGHWASYPQQVVARTFNNFPSSRLGADIVVSSTLPVASGMSSSSAFVVGIFLCLSSINRLRDDRAYSDNIYSNLDLADYLSTVENGGNYRKLSGSSGVGTLGGSEDHTAILTSRQGQLGLYSYRPTTSIEYLDFPDNLSIVIVSSGVSAEKSGNAMADYNRASQLCSEIVDIYNSELGTSHPHLGDIIVQPDFSISKMRKVLTGNRSELVDRFSHFYLENVELLPAFTKAVKDRDLIRMGEVVYESFDCADRLLGNQIDETRHLVEEAKNLGAYGASAFGAGFGGSVYAITSRDHAEQFADSWFANYTQTYPSSRNSAKIHIDKPENGVIASLDG